MEPSRLRSEWLWLERGSIRRRPGRGRGVPRRSPPATGRPPRRSAQSNPDRVASETARLPKPHPGSTPRRDGLLLPACNLTLDFAAGFGLRGPPSGRSTCGRCVERSREVDGLDQEEADGDPGLAGVPGRVREEPGEKKAVTASSRDSGGYEEFDQRPQQSLAPPPDVVHELLVSTPESRMSLKGNRRSRHTAGPSCGC